MKKPSDPQAANRSDIKAGEISQVLRGWVSGLRPKKPAARENREPSVPYSDYRDDLTLNDADIIEIENRYIPGPRDGKCNLSAYADDLTLNDADITDLEKQRVPEPESYRRADDLRDYADDLTLNDADIVEIESRYVLIPGDEQADIRDHADDLTLNDADIREIESLRSRADAGPGDRKDEPEPDYPPPADDYPDDLSLNNADIIDLDRFGRTDARFGNRAEPDAPNRHNPLSDDGSVFEDYADDLSLNNADIIDLDSPGILSGHPDARPGDTSESDDRDIIDMDDAAVIDTDQADILSDLPAEIIELMYCTENDSHEIRNDESIMPEIIREVMGLAGDEDSEGGLSCIAESGLSDTDSPAVCPTNETDFLKEQNELIELTDISTDFIDDNEDTVVNFEKRELRENNDIIELTDMAIPLPDDDEDTVDLEEKDNFPEKNGIRNIREPDAHDGEPDGKKLVLSEIGEDASSFTGDFNEFSDDGESDLSEDIEAVAELINIIVHFPDDDTESADDAEEKKKKDLLELLEKDIAEDTELADSAGYYYEEDEDDGDIREEETDSISENDRTERLRAENEDSDRRDTAHIAADRPDIGTEKDIRGRPDFYFPGETDEDLLMEKDLIDLLEMDSESYDEGLSENRTAFQDSSDMQTLFIKSGSEIQYPEPEQTEDRPRKSRDTLADYLEDIVKDIICEKIDQIVIDQQRIVDVIEKAVLKEKIKLIRDLTADG